MHDYNDAIKKTIASPIGLKRLVTCKIIKLLALMERPCGDHAAMILNPPFT